MPKQKLHLDSIGDVDGGSLRVAVNQALKTLTQDLEDRPALKKKRKMVLTMWFEPVVDTNGNQIQLESVLSSWDVDVDCPKTGKAGTVMTPQSDGQLAFHSDLPDSPEDETIMDEAQRARRQQKD
jgi:hypothetical protein